MKTTIRNWIKGFSFIVCPTIVTLILITTLRPHTTGLHQEIESIYWVELFVPPWLLVICVSQNNNLHDVTSAILVCQHDKTAAMLVWQTNPVGVEFFSLVKTFFCFNLHSRWPRGWIVRITLYTKTLRTVKTSPRRFFFWSDPVQTWNFSLTNQILQLSTRKRLTFESIKSDISNLDRTIN